ncbi:MAG TPA: hypothetical protein DCY48_04940 [Candidatus Magasanikbacteria bacterium]|nr:MAG: hypothetical protein A3I74_03420 [Candidatus Magasanikbacteria bacterium RIFCSPLOWO2_02_FULL_47_16]OGH80255.1 MAG: hypothetical protein A3C10_03700 [Candidatus Magasanikbacteria bacterium RIFCSPHIGHO2_02_FULL_48_18]HAZ29085.1 hypothetical protein [Candidatus Magasanikbacteria bacterium]
MKLFHSIHAATRGIRYVFSHEQNFRIQLSIGFLVFWAGVFFRLSRNEIIVILWLILFILVLELVNSAVEKFMDIVKPRLSMHVEITKDIMAGVVFLASCGAALIGIIIFFPHVIEFFVSP